MKTTTRLFLASAALLAAGITPAPAATFNWEGDTGNAWSTPGNWEENVAPPNDGTADLIFRNLGGEFPSITPAYSIDSLTWVAGAKVFNYDGGPLTLGAGGFTQNSTSAENFSTAQVILGAAQTWTLASGSGALTFGAGVNTNASNLTINAATTTGSGNVINGNFTGSGAVTTIGAGILTLTGASTYTGATTVSDGTLAVTGTLSDTTIAVGAGANFSVTGSGAFTSTGTDLVLDGTSAKPAITMLASSAALSRGSVIVADSDNSAGSLTQSSGSLSVNLGGLFSIGRGSGSRGSYTLSGSGSSLSTGKALVGSGGSGIFTQSGGTFTTNGSGLFLAFNPSSNGSYNLSGGSVTTGRTQVSDDDSTATFTQSGGTHTTATLSLTGYSTRSQGTYYLNGGTLKVGTVTSGDNGVRGTSIFNFNGGTLQASGGLLTFFQDLTRANVRGNGSTANSGALIDTNGFGITIAQPLVHSNLSGDAAIDGGLTKLGTGTLTLIGANTYTGATIISGGTLQVGNGGVAGTLGAGNVTNNAALIFNRSNATSYNGAISGTGTVTKQGAGILTLTGANTYADATTISGGTLQVGNGGTAGTLGAGNVTNNAALVFNRSDDLSYNGAISGTGTLTKGGAGILSLGGNTSNSFTGLTSVAAGTLVLNKSVNINTLALGGDLSIGDSRIDPTAGTLPTAIVRYIQDDSLKNTAAVTVSGNGLFDLSASSGSAKIGVLTMKGGETRLGVSILTLNSDALFNASAAGSQITSTTFSDSLNLNGTRTFTVANGAATYDLNVTAGLFNGTLVKAGPGVLRLDADNDGSFVGPAAITLNAGTLAVARDAAIPSSTPLTFGGGTLVADRGDRTVAAGVNTIANSTVGSSLDGAQRGLSFTGATSLAAGTALTVSNDGSTTFSNVVSGAGGILKTGAGTLTLGNSANTFTGGLTLNGGTLAIASEGSLGGAANVVVLNAGRLQFTADSTTARTFNFNNALTLGTAAGTTLTFGNGASANGGFLGAGGTLAFADGSNLNGTTSLIGSTLTQPSGTATFDNVTVRGAFAQSAGATLNVASGLNLSTSGVLTVNGTTSLINGGEFLGRTTINNGGRVSVAQAVSLFLGGGSRTTINSGGTLAAAIGGSGTPANPAAGTIELNGGLLVNNGTQTGALNVNFGGSLKGGGTFGTINVTDGGKFSPGNSPGNAATVGDFNLNAAGRYEFELNQANYTTSDGHADFLAVGGVIAANAGTTSATRFTIAIISLNAGNSSAPLADFNAALPYSFTLATAAAGVTGFDAAEFVVDTSAFGNALAGGSFAVGVVGNDLRLNFNPVPEPSAAVLACAGLALLVRRRRV